MNNRTGAPQRRARSPLSRRIAMLLTLFLFLEAIVVGLLSLMFYQRGELAARTQSVLSLASIAANADFRIFIAQIFVSALVMAILAGAVSAQYVKRNVGAPIHALTGVTRQMAKGDTQIRLDAAPNNEMAQLYGALREMAACARQQAAILTRISNRDYREGILHRGDGDALNASIERILDTSIQLIDDVRDSSIRIANGASRILTALESRADRGPERAEALERLSNAILGIRQQAEQNTGAMRENLLDLSKAEELIAECAAQMPQMTRAMDTVRESGRTISQIVKAVDEIAFHANVLAINAAVAASRAGLRGRSYTVVTDEARRLAQKSAQAVKDAETITETYLQNAQLCDGILQKAEERLTRSAWLASDSAQRAQATGEASRNQANAAQEIRNGLARVVAATLASDPATAEIAAAAEQVGAQAAMLERLVEPYILPSHADALYEDGPPVPFEPAAAEEVMPASIESEVDGNDMPVPIEPEEDADDMPAPIEPEGAADTPHMPELSDVTELLNLSELLDIIP